LYAGDEETIYKYKSYVKRLTPYLLSQERERVLSSINSIRHTTKRKYSDFAKDGAGSDTEPDNEDDVHNPYENVASARQVHESVESFLKRMDPITIGPSLENTTWIWIADFKQSSPYRIDSEEDVPQHAEFMKRGKALLHAFRETRDEFEQRYQGSSEAFVGRKLKPQREKLKQNILNLAKECGITSGKVRL
jgi:elongation factor P--beta-lysine ligase